jgi:hypothetical protein
MIDRAAWRYLEGPEQMLMLRTIGAPREAAVREEYGAWLAERGDARAELLAIEAAGPPGDPARVEAILASDEGVRAWWSVVSSTAPIRNCGEAMIEATRVRFAYRCPRSWEGLAPTGDANARHCDTCLQLVHLCTSREEAELRARRGDCIAVPAGLAGEIARDVTRMITGRPDPVAEWAERVFSAKAGEE